MGPQWLKNQSDARGPMIVEDWGISCDEGGDASGGINWDFEVQEEVRLVRVQPACRQQKFPAMRKTP